MKVKVIACTPEPEKTIAMAAKLCYSPVGVDEIEENLTDEKVEKFVNNLRKIGHLSPFEHATFTFAVEGISRACTHQLVRHRLASYSQQSQRYVKLDQFEYIIPPEIKNCKGGTTVFKMHMEESQKAYDKLVDMLIEEGRTEKEAIEDARYVFPNACETKIVFTMNVRNLLHFFEQRCCERAQWEIREMAYAMLDILQKTHPILFKDAGPKCVRGKCPEGAMSCGHPKTTK